MNKDKATRRMCKNIIYKPL